MRIALLVALLAVAGCEDDRRASRRDRYDDDSRSYGGLRAQRDRDDLMRKLDDDLMLRKKPPIAIPQSTGAWECDELVRLTNCAWDKYGTAVPPEARKAFDDGVKMWRDALQNDATRQATIEACKMSIDGGRAGFDAMGCS